MGVFRATPKKGIIWVKEYAMKNQLHSSKASERHRPRGSRNCMNYEKYKLKEVQGTQSNF